jgi:hypothetical protein
MNHPTPSPAIARGRDDDTPASRLRRIVRKSALLNVVIVLTSFPVLVMAGGPNSVVPAVAIMAGITFLIWTATFTLFSCVSLSRLVWTAFSADPQRKPSRRARRGGVADRWLDAPG